MTAFNHAQDPYTAALEVLVLELTGALINSQVLDGTAFTARLQLYVEALNQGAMPKSRQGAYEIDRLLGQLRQVQPVAFPD